MNGETLAPTFRDPAGSLRLEQDRAVRTIRADAAGEALEFIESAFYRAMVERGEMVASEVEQTSEGLRLFHPRVRVPAYPWEWTPSQWMAAAELTLKLCDEALDHGWILKDATPLNILFVGSRPVLVDVLSFERRKPESGIWLAYGQYVRTFLLPLLMHRMLAWPLELTLFRRDGYEPAELYQALSWSQRLSPAAFWPVTLPAWLEGKEKTEKAAAKAQTKRVADPGLTLNTLKRTLSGLRKRTRSLAAKENRSEWSDYTSHLVHYTAEQSEDKRRWVQEALRNVQAQFVLDVGANTGEFSVLAAETGAEVVALERDAEAAERIVRRVAAKKLAVQTIHADFARPTPAVGWRNRESLGLLARLEGGLDVVMLLAVIHHLILLEQIPLGEIMELCRRVTRHWLIVEWVPTSDPMFISLMRGRDELYGRLSEDDLMAACVGHFEVRRRHALSNGRILFLLELISQ